MLGYNTYWVEHFMAFPISWQRNSCCLTALFSMILQAIPERFWNEKHLFYLDYM